MKSESVSIGFLNCDRFEANFGNDLADLATGFMLFVDFDLIVDLDLISFLYSEVLCDVTVQWSDCSFDWSSLGDGWKSIMENVIRLRKCDCCRD